MSLNQVIQADVTCNHVPSDMLFWEGHGTNVGIVSADRAPSAPSHEGTADRPKLRDFPQGNSPVLFKNVRAKDQKQVVELSQNKGDQSNDHWMQCGILGGVLNQKENPWWNLKAL